MVSRAPALQRPPVSAGERGAQAPRAWPIRAGAIGGGGRLQTPCVLRRCHHVKRWLCGASSEKARGDSGVAGCSAVGEDCPGYWRGGINSTESTPPCTPPSSAQSGIVGPHSPSVSYDTGGSIGGCAGHVSHAKTPQPMLTRALRVPFAAYVRPAPRAPLQRRRLPIPHDAPAPPPGGLDGLRQAAAASSSCMSPTIAILPIHERGALYDRGRRSVRCYGLRRGTPVLGVRGRLGGARGEEPSTRGVAEKWLSFSYPQGHGCLLGATYINLAAAG
jgi:hypothetical protein